MVATCPAGGGAAECSLTAVDIVHNVSVVRAGLRHFLCFTDLGGGGHRERALESGSVRPLRRPSLEPSGPAGGAGSSSRRPPSASAWRDQACQDAQALDAAPLLCVPQRSLRPQTRPPRAPAASPGPAGRSAKGGSTDSSVRAGDCGTIPSKGTSRVEHRGRVVGARQLGEPVSGRDGPRSGRLTLRLPPPPLSLRGRPRQLAWARASQPCSRDPSVNRLADWSGKGAVRGWPLVAGGGRFAR